MKLPPSCDGNVCKKASQDYHQEQSTEVSKAIEEIIFLRSDMLKRITRLQRGSVERADAKIDLLEHYRMILQNYLTLLSKKSVAPEVALDLVERWRKQFSL